MPKKRRKPPFWRRGNPARQYDIKLLRPENRPRGQRFETLQDARAESERSEELLRSFSGGSKELAEFLQECRAGDYQCNKPFCPVCARIFRRWFIAELLRVTKGHDPVYIYTVLLKESSHDRINDLDPTPYRHQLRKRLERAGLGNAPVIGGFEIVYKARRRVWVLHVNLVVIGGKKSAHEKFEELSSKNSEVERSTMRVNLKDRAEQLSYILKFGTYHRPHAQHGPNRTDAKPLNPREHAALVKWMSQFEFKDFLFLVNAKRLGGTKIVLRDQSND